MRFIKRVLRLNGKEEKKNTSISEHLQTRMSHIGRKMSKGASDIFKMMKTHAKWGNNNLWGSREKKGHHKPR